VKVLILRTIFFWATLHGGKAMKNFQNPNSKSLYFHKHQSCGIEESGDDSSLISTQILCIL
jgi:hypothetical protein